MSRAKLPVSEDAIENQQPLPATGAVASPLVSKRLRVECPVCSREVSDSRRPHTIPLDVVDEPGLEARDVDEVSVYGWACDYCSLVLPLEPAVARREPAIAPPSEGWIAVAITPETGPRMRGYVPAREVIR